MRTTLHYQGRAFRVDSIEPYTHAVLVRANKEPFIPRGRAMSPKEINDLPPEERAQVLEDLRAFARDEVRTDRFAVQLGRWATSTEEAAAMVAAFEAETVTTGEGEGAVTALKYDLVFVEPVSR